MQAMLLAAGLGTRLRPLTEERPKPVVPVANVPLALFALEAMAAAGVRRVVANAHHLPDELERRLRDAAPGCMDLTVVREPELLGTGGGLRNAWAHLDPDQPMLVMNSDILFAPDLRAILAAHNRSGAMATMVLRPDPHAARFGAVEVDEAGWVRRLLGQPEEAPGPLRALMFTGVHVVSPQGRAALPREGCIIRRSYRAWVDRGDGVLGLVDETAWRDLGTLEAYLRANLDLASGALAWPGVASGPDGTLVHPEAVVAPAAILRRAVVGAAARIGPGARVEDSVVWDGAVVEGEVRGAVVTPMRVVPAL